MTSEHLLSRTAGGFTSTASREEELVRRLDDARNHALGQQVYQLRAIEVRDENGRATVLDTAINDLVETLLLVGVARLDTDLVQYETGHHAKLSESVGNVNAIDAVGDAVEEVGDCDVEPRQSLAIEFLQD